MTTDDAMEPGPSRDRSPSFPFISLPRAIERARQMYDAHRREAARPIVVGRTWGYTPKSSGLLQTIAALKQFGLIEDVGRGEDRKIQLSELGRHILVDNREPERTEAIQEAALRPKMITEYFPKWSPTRPSDAHCLSELHLDRGFGEVAAKVFLRVFDETISFANISFDDYKQPSYPSDPNKDKSGDDAFYPPTVTQKPPPQATALTPVNFFGATPVMNADAPLNQRLQVTSTSSSVFVNAVVFTQSEADKLIQILQAIKPVLGADPTPPAPTPVTAYPKNE